MALHARVLGFLSGPCLLPLAMASMPGVSFAQNANDGFHPNAGIRLRTGGTGQRQDPRWRRFHDDRWADQAA